MMSDIAVLNVYLNTSLVGQLTRLPGERISFDFADSYLAQPDRPTLSQSFINITGDVMTGGAASQTKAPSFFANLLPEGHLREYLASKAGIKSARDFSLLQLLGHDLPGAVILKPADNIDQTQNAELSLIETDKADPGILKFSLAGVQLKFSALQEAHGGLTIPAHGYEGDWIVKLPSAQFQHVPENEYSMLQLAKAIGIDVPDTQLINIEDITHLPDIAYQQKGKALAVKRFDREAEKRIHVEDFAQVYGLYPNKKYQKVSCGNMLGKINVVMGEVQAKEFIKRLIFSVLMGNGDMHLKNWALIYRDGIHPTLAPAYDYVSTQVYLPNETLALSVAGEKNMTKLSRDHFIRMANKVNFSKALLIKTLQQTMEATTSQWQAIKQELPMPIAMMNKVDRHIVTTIKQLMS